MAFRDLGHITGNYEYEPDGARVATHCPYKVNHRDPSKGWGEGGRGPYIPVIRTPYRAHLI